MKNTLIKLVSLLLAAVMLAACLTAGGCAPASEPAAEPVVSYPNVPQEYADLFHGGFFDWDNIWTTDDPRYADLTAALHKQCDKSFNGSFIVATDDKVIFAGGWDAVQTDGETTVDPFTTYEIGSVTKQFTAVAILQQVQAGKIDVNDTIDKYFPDYPYGSQITVDNLLHMDSGIHDLLGGKLYDGNDKDDEDFMQGRLSDGEILEKLNTVELDFNPGKIFAYSNTNFWLLALILEQVSGMTYEEYLQQNIFDVCGMHSSSACEVGNLTSVPEHGQGYMPTARCCRGTGDIHSTVCDLLRWNRALFGGRLLDEQQMEYMTAKRRGYSCGWMDDEFDGLGHSGSTWSYAAYNIVFTMENGENLYVSGMTGNKGSAKYGLYKTIETVDDWVK